MLRMQSYMRRCRVPVCGGLKYVWDLGFFERFAWTIGCFRSYGLLAVLKW